MQQATPRYTAGEWPSFYEWQRSNRLIRSNPRWQQNQLRHALAPIAVAAKNIAAAFSTMFSTFCRVASTIVEAFDGIDLTDLDDYDWTDVDAHVMEFEHSIAEIDEDIAAAAQRIASR